MYFRLMWNDVRKNQVITLALTAFIAAASMLVSLAAIMAGNLWGSIELLMTQAETPHFMQMHSGELDMDPLLEFAARQENVESFQVLSFLNLDNSRIRLGERFLTGSVTDNGISVQSQDFDYLLDLDGQVISPGAGELYIPISYGRDGGARVGDSAWICGREFVIAGYLRDSQMNSTLSSSKRFLVSDVDFQALKREGAMEYLIEFRVKDIKGLGELETAYTSAGLPSNGPAVTYPLFKLMNAISDGLMIGVILLVCALVTAIAFLCIRFTLLTKIEEDYKEIGVMKAIGFRIGWMKRLYLARYAAIGLLGGCLGLALSLFFRGKVLENIRLYMGLGRQTLMPLAWALAGTAVIFMAVMAYVNGILNRFRRISAAQAIRFGSPKEKAAGAGRFHLGTGGLLPINVRLGLLDVHAKKGLYGTMLAVLIIAAFLMAIPLNLYHTISSRSFAAYMGIGDSDMRMDLQQEEDIADKAAAIERALLQDKAVEKAAVLTTKSCQTDTGQRIKVEIGDHMVFPVAYQEGRAPKGAGEIALSALNAEELGKRAGDRLTLVFDGIREELTVCGIYSDITNGGKTAKAAVDFGGSQEVMWSVIYAEFREGAAAASKIQEYTRQFPYAKTAGIEDYMAQTFGQTIQSVRTASYGALAAAVFIALAVTLLFIKLLIKKDGHSIAVMKALGFTSRDIVVQYAVQSVFVLFLAVLAGVLLTNTLGEGLAGLVMSAFGVMSFHFRVNWLSAYLLCPIMLACSVLIAVLLGTSEIYRMKLSDHREE